ncbi:MAG: 5-(carboxyamino)imidazole ribonucleotide synthase [Acidimicrobiales bacterium]|nr:5-(carboxyamino)imidazole ribonucleotide synthase [Hyphomonadaceae bacterium]RZV42277.1 MAG: 5-(carboxyamino)imidazole ribonucleotide synthase [Acidimicrobiales bacterium]
MTPLKPGSTIGIFGGGQLGRMLSQSAQKLGFKVHIYDPHTDTPAGRISNFKSAAPYEEMAAIARFAKDCDVITYEFENIPTITISAAQQFTPVHPNVKALQTAQDRLIEKTFLAQKADAPVIDFRKIDTVEDLHQAVSELGLPAILKTRRFGYDGKGQIKIDDIDEIPAAFKDLGGKNLILEAFAPFVREVSIVAARDHNGNVKCFPLTENVHKNHILHTSSSPTSDPQNVEETAKSIAHRVLDALDYVGVLAVEFFELDGGKLIVNEIAPRVHNSGHWTMDGDCADQFEQHIRAISGLELGDPKPKVSVIMTNLIGDEIEQIPAYQGKPNTHVHDYDKKEVREGRKMGHINVTKPLTDR